MQTLDEVAVQHGQLGVSNQWQTPGIVPLNGKSQDKGGVGTLLWKQNWLLRHAGMEHWHKYPFLHTLQQGTSQQGQGHHLLPNYMPHVTRESRRTKQTI